MVKDFGQDEDFNAVGPHRATGIVFRAEIKPESTKNIIDGEAQTMYVYDHTLYYSSKEIHEQIQQQENTNLKAAFNACFDVDANTGAVAEKAGIKVEDYQFVAYRPVDGKYYCYYFYYNQHVDDGEDSTIGKMEFATVRNNIYKLAVSKVDRLGTFEVPEPGQWDIYFKVTVQVKDWVVRINDGIEF